MNYSDAIATVPSGFALLGTALRPFCLGHHLLLRKLVPNFAGDCSDDDLLLAIAICARSYEETLEDLLAGRWAQSLADWKKAVRGPWWNRRRVDWKQVKTLWLDYLADGYSGPRLSPTTSKGKTLTAPWEEITLCRLVAAGWSPSDALNCYLPAAHYHAAASMELRFGEPRFYNEVHYEQDMLVKAAREAMQTDGIPSIQTGA